MIKFFRRIRQRLLSESKFSKYLLYALGEIVLVMFGILLALQVSNWNSERLDRISERQLLDNIHRDFLANKAIFDSVKTRNYMNKANLDSMVALLPIDGDTAKYRAFWSYSRQTKGILINVYSSTVEAVINSNSLELIQDEELQGYLVSWKEVVLDFQEDELIYNKMINDQYWPYIARTIDYLEGNSEGNLKAASSFQFANLVIQRRNYFRHVINAIENEPMEHHIKEIIRLTAPEE